MHVPTASDDAVQIANYEAEEERKRTEREEAGASEGWTVVKRHKVCFHAAPSWHM